MIPVTLHAQEEDILDKYQSISKRKLKLESSVPELLEQASQLSTTDPSAALDKVEEALALSITQKSSYNEASCYLMLGKINEGINEWDLAITNYEKARIMFSGSYEQTPVYLETLGGLINSYRQTRRYDSAIYAGQLKLKVGNSNSSRAETYLDLADIAFESGNDEQAMKYVQDAEKRFGRIPSKNNQVRATGIRSKILAQRNQVDEAQQLYQQNIAFNDLFPDSLTNTDLASIESSKEELIEALNRQNRSAEAIDIRNQSIADNTLRGNTKKVSREKVALSKELVEIGKTDDAIKQLEEASQLASTSGDFVEQAEAFQTLAEAYHDKGRSQQALEAYRRYSEVMDQIQQVEATNQQQKEQLIKKQQDIVSLSKDLELDESKYNLALTSYQLRENQLILQRLAIYGLIFLLFGSMIGSVLIYRNARRSKTMSQLLALKSLRSQMNPHFIFNALNSVNQFIALNDERAANKFLTEFSRLMRLVLDNSQKDFITLAEEKEIIALYLKLEHYRFRDKFEYELDIQDDIVLDSVEIPPMLIQPYVENAIWHGLRYKEEVGSLKVSIREEDKQLVVVIADNGIGREASRQLKTANQKQHNSTGLKNIEERLRIINKVYRKHYQVKIEDLSDQESGTQVTVILPYHG